ncbi:GNAT family N-acetyltransferase [Candidatus Thorarchaeota archaeon]|nr:MAG: GNAT family N-acetyltransferase [Candidatus Thorarchaeota archaeon]
MEPEIRTLKKEDISAIVEISKTTWGGHDHLPNIIDEWIENICCHPYVLVSKNEVIGVANIRIIDDGMTGWLEGLRVHEKARNQGFAKQLTDHLFIVAKQLRVQRIRLVRSLESEAPQRLADSIGMNQIHTWKVFWKDVREVEWRFDGIQISEIQPNEVKGKLKEFPELIAMPDNPNPFSHSILRHWDLYETTDENIEDLAKHSSYHFGQSDIGVVFSIGGIESSSYVPEWCFTLYATNEDAFLSGLSKNLELAREQGSNLLMCIHQPEFTHMYDSVDWLKERNHDISLTLHERYFTYE